MKAKTKKVVLKKNWRKEYESLEKEAMSMEKHIMYLNERLGKALDQKSPNPTHIDSQSINDGAMKIESKVDLTLDQELEETLLIMTTISNNMSNFRFAIRKTKENMRQRSKDMDDIVRIFSDII